MITPLLLALSFLTCLPVKIVENLTERDFKRSFIYFPIVGLAIGLFSIGVIDLTSKMGLDEGIIAIIAVITFAIISRGLHIDGLADTVDGFYGGKDKEGRLLIMKDSHTGSFGIAAIVFLLVAQFTAMTVVVNENRLEVVPVAFAFSRWAMVLLSFKAKYPREGGTAKPFVGNITVVELLLATIFVTLIGFYFIGNNCFIVLAVTAVVTMIVRNISYSKIEGITGDVLGAVGEISVTILLMLATFI